MGEKETMKLFFLIGLSLTLAEEDYDERKPGRKPIDKIKFKHEDLTTLKDFYMGLVDTYFQGASKPEKVKRKFLKTMKKVDKFISSSKGAQCVISDASYEAPTLSPCA